MRNHAFSLQSGNEAMRGLRQSSWSCCKSFHGNDSRHLRRAIASSRRQQDKQLSRAFLGRQAERRDTGAQDRRHDQPRAGRIDDMASHAGLAAQFPGCAGRSSFITCNNEYIFISMLESACDSRIRKFQKAQLFRTFYPPAPGRRHEFGLSDRHFGQTARVISANYNKPANLRHYLHELGTRSARDGRSIRQPCAKVKRILPLPCVLGLAAPQHRNFCTAESELYSFQR